MVNALSYIFVKREREIARERERERERLNIVQWTFFQI